MFKNDVRDAMKFYEDQLHDVGRKAIPHAARFATNQTAGDVRAQYVREAKAQMTLRNAWTQRGIRYTQTRSLNMRRMVAYAGSWEEYMAERETAHTEQSKGKHGVRWPTSYAAGQYKQTPRTKVVRKPNRMASVQLNKRRPGASMPRRQRVAATIKQAQANKQRFVFLELQDRKGIFRLHGGFRRPQLRMVHDMTKRAVVVPGRPMLEKASRYGAKRQPWNYVRALRFQLERIQHRDRRV